MHFDAGYLDIGNPRPRPFLNTRKSVLIIIIRAYTTCDSIIQGFKKDNFHRR